MPIRPENRARYPDDWKQISQRVRNDAGNRCEWCNAPNNETIQRGTDRARASDQSVPAYRTMDLTAYEASICADTGTYIAGTCAYTFDTQREVKVILTVAHLDHQPENCARENLRALCQRCHNRYDAPARRRGREKRRFAAGLFGGTPQ